MRVVLSDRAIEALKDAPPAVARAFYKQLRFLADNLRHPSRRAKKYDEEGEHRVDLECEVVNSDGEPKVSGVAVAALPAR